MRRTARIVICAAVVIAALAYPLRANNISEPYISDPEPTMRERLEQMASRGEIRTIMAEVTAYDVCEECTTELHGITASGAPVEVGMVAVDPDVIPLGSRLYMEDVGMVLAADTGNEVKGVVIDRYVPTHAEAVKWGRQVKKVYILGR